MHLIVPFACTEAATATLRDLPLPELDRLLATLTPTHEDTGDIASWNTPAERAWARDLGVQGGDGRLPLAALAFATQATDPAPALCPPGTPAAWFTLCHWQVGAEDVRMGQAPQWARDADEDAALLALLQPFVAEVGLSLSATPSAPTGTWLLTGEPLRGLRCASIDRVAGRPLPPWMAEGPGAKALNTLQGEVQMLLYTQALNDAREARGAAPLNAFWLHGAGVLDTPPEGREPPRVIDDLRASAVLEDWTAWADHWRRIDRELVPGWQAEAQTALGAGFPWALTLCGERHAITLEPRRTRWWQRLAARRASAHELLARL